MNVDSQELSQAFIERPIHVDDTSNVTKQAGSRVAVSHLADSEYPVTSSPSIPIVTVTRSLKKYYNPRFIFHCAMKVANGYSAIEAAIQMNRTPKSNPMRE